MCFSVNGSVCLVCCVFDSVCEFLVKQFAICLSVVVILLLNVWCVWRCSVAMQNKLIGTNIAV